LSVFLFLAGIARLAKKKHPNCLNLCGVANDAFYQLGFLGVLGELCEIQGCPPKYPQIFRKTGVMSAGYP